MVEVQAGKVADKRQPVDSVCVCVCVAQPVPPVAVTHRLCLEGHDHDDEPSISLTLGGLTTLLQVNCIIFFRSNVEV